MVSCIRITRRFFQAGILAWALSRCLVAEETPAKETPPLRAVESSEITSILEQALRKEWKIDDGDLVVSFEKSLPEIRVPAGELSLRWVTRLSQPARRIFPQFEL
ncbi:MAG: hypothetical protein ACKO3H_05860, partial [Verrucomicrobiota bacterium]